MQANTGPITVASVSAADPLGDWTEHVSANTEQLVAYRGVSDGRIITPHCDPHSGDEATAGYAQGQPNGTWADQNIIDHTEHIFDFREFGGDGWLCGADLDQSTDPVDAGACVWRLPDGETAWARSLIGPRAPLRGDLKRFYGFVIAGGKMRVREQETGQAFVWTGTDWVDDGIRPVAPGGPGLSWGDSYIYPNGLPFGANAYDLLVFDGTLTRTLAPSVHGFSIGDDGSVYVVRLGANGRAALVSRVDEPGTLQDLGTFGTAGARILPSSLCVLPGSRQAVVGLSTSRLALVDLS